MRVPVFTFATFVTAPPAGRIAAVTGLKHQPDYDPAIDWWKRLRDFIPRNHRANGTKADIDSFVDGVTGRKEPSYRARAEAYKDWWGPRNIRWVGGSPLPWTSGNVEVSVNPELFISVDGVRHVVKLYFKGSERLTADRANVVLRLMELKYRGGATPDGRPVCGVLDLVQEEFHVPTSSLAYLDPLLTGEAAAFSSVWRAV
jgi:hypothetical protein